MQLGMIGLGRMGASLVRRLSNDGHDCVVFDLNPAAVSRISGGRIQGALSISDLLSRLAQPRVVWLMLPAGVTGTAVEEVASHMAPGDIIVDGGNSDYRDDLLRADALKLAGIHYVDCGTSGGVISSWLLDLTAASLMSDPELKNYTGQVSDSGEGRWTVEAAIDEAVPIPVLSAALFARFSSRGRADFANHALSAMRKQFGGHEEKPK